MNDILLFLHLLGLIMGAGPGMASMIVGRAMAGATPDQQIALRRLPPVFANISAAGLILMWVTGLILVFSKWSGPGSLPGMFWVKFVFVLLLTAVVVAIHLTYAEIKGAPSAAYATRLQLQRLGPAVERAKRLGPMAGLCALLATLFAVLAFH